MLKFYCKHCKGKIGVKDEYAGRRVRCPKCKEAVRAPKPAPPEDDFDLEMVGAGDSGSGEDFDLEMVSEGDGASGGLSGGGGDLAALAAMEANASAAVQSAGATCPSCRSVSKPGAALCVACGYNFKSGKQLNTAVRKAPKAGKKQTADRDDYNPDADPPWKNILWGVFLILVAIGIYWYLWDFENSMDESREVHFVIAWLYNVGGPTFGKWLASVPFGLIGIFMVVWGVRGKEIA